MVLVFIIFGLGVVGENFFGVFFLLQVTFGILIITFIIVKIMRVIRVTILCFLSSLQGFFVYNPPDFAQNIHIIFSF